VETRVKYSGYIERQQRQIERFRALEDKRIPSGFDFTAVEGLRFEAREKFAALSPRSLGQAARISGISPADVTVVWVALQRRQHGTPA
jgi:tRNA uridine 5-carboxymethylaminomethyl modification enzyme